MESNANKNTVVLTGGNGLLGRNFLPMIPEGYETLSLVKREPENRYKNTHYQRIDLSSDWKSSVLPDQCDVVVHLAQSEKFRNFPKDALNVFGVNLSTVAKLLDYARYAGTKKIVIASSGGVYGYGQNAFEETPTLKVDDHLGYYLGTKLSTEILAKSYANYLDVIILRFFFIYGAGQRSTMLIPRLVENIKSGNTIQLDGESGIRINPIHVSDAAKAVKAAMQLEGSHTINVAGPQVLSLKEICNSIGKLLHMEPNFQLNDSTVERNLVGDIDKMRELLGAPSVTFTEGIHSILCGN